MVSDPVDSNAGYDNFQASEAAGKAAYTYADRVIARWKQVGFASRPRPKLTEDHEGIFSTLKSGQYFDGRLPTVIKKLSLDQISALYSLFSNWFAYVQQQTEIVGAQRSEAKRQERLMWSMIREKHKQLGRNTGTKISEQRASDSTRIDIRYIEADAKYEELNVTYSFMQAMVEVAKQDLSTISREITIRQAELESGARGRGFGNRTADGSVPRAVRFMRNTSDDRSDATPKKATGRQIKINKS
jgi:hypothetical protein